MKRIPIADCPKCGRTLIYSGDPKDKHNITLCIADDNYIGKSVYCAKCKTMLAITELQQQTITKPDQISRVPVLGTISI